MADYLSSLEKEVAEKSASAKNGMDMVDLLSEYDSKVKERLRYVFGQENDFEEIFDGCNVMAIASNGEMVITNFLNGIRPIIEDGIKEYAKMEAKKVRGI